MFYYFYLSLAILFEIAATSLLKLSQGFSKLFFGCLALMFYGFCFFFISIFKGHSVKSSLRHLVWNRSSRDNDIIYSALARKSNSCKPFRDKSSYCRTCFIELITKDSLENGELYV